jgi:hypothetical protein
MESTMFRPEMRKEVCGVESMRSFKHTKRSGVASCLT